MKSTHFFRRVISILFPARCVGCGGWGRYLCDDCLFKVGFLEKQYCPACKKSAILGFASHGCGKRTSLDQLISLCWYRGVVRSLVMNYKFAPYVKNLESEIERLMLQSLSPEDVFDWSTGIVIPVPLHKSKLKQRGFNQSEAIAHVLAKIVGGEVSASLLVRTRASGVQSSIKDDRLRVQNVRGVFSVNKALIARYSSAKVFVLVDDVYTSGSTLQECARVIKRSFPQSSVVGFTLARG